MIDQRAFAHNSRSHHGAYRRGCQRPDPYECPQNALATLAASIHTGLTDAR